MQASLTERALYEEMWSFEAYGETSRGERYAEKAVELLGVGTVLDAGTGSGKGALALQKLGCTVFGCDLTLDGLVPEARGAFPAVEACLWHDLYPVAYMNFGSHGFFDWVYCCDVLEHLPKEYVLLAAARMQAVAKRGVLISVGLTQESWGLFAGGTLHKTVEQFTWWRDSLRELGELIEARDMLDRALFVLKGAYHA